MSPTDDGVGKNTFKNSFQEKKILNQSKLIVKNNGKKITQNHVFTHNYDSIFKKFLISKKEIGIDILYYLNFEKIIKPND